MENLRIFTGNANPVLAEKIAEVLGQEEFVKARKTADRGRIDQ